jgi:hypothetical protein
MEEASMNALQKVLQQHIAQGWVVTFANDQLFSAWKHGSLSAILAVLGVLGLVASGFVAGFLLTLTSLLSLLLALVARDSLTITTQGAEAILRQQEETERRNRERQELKRLAGEQWRMRLSSARGLRKLRVYLSQPIYQILAAAASVVIIVAIAYGMSALARSDVAFKPCEREIGISSVALVAVHGEPLVKRQASGGLELQYLRVKYLLSNDPVGERLVTRAWCR